MVKRAYVSEESWSLSSEPVHYVWNKTISHTESKISDEEFDTDGRFEGVEKRERRDNRRFEKSDIERQALEEDILVVSCGCSSASGFLRLGLRRNKGGDFKGLVPSRSPSHCTEEGGTQIEPE